MPEIRPATCTGGIKLDDRRCSLDRTERWMRCQLSETNGKALLLRIIEVELAAKEDDLVLQKQPIDRGNRLLR